MYAERSAARAVLVQAARSLADRLPKLAERLVAEIRDGSPDYAAQGGAFDEDLIRKLSHDGLRAGLRAIIDPRAPRADLRFAEYLGRTHAERGRPLDALLRAYRLAGRMLWEELLDVVAVEQPDQLATLARSVPHSWKAIDLQSNRASESYHRRRDELLSQDADRVYEALDALLEDRDPGHLAPVAARLGLPKRGRYAVVAASGGPPDTAADGRTPPNGGIRLIWREGPGVAAGIAHLGTEGLDQLVEGLRPVLNGNAGVSLTVGGLSELGRARRMADLALRTCTGAGPEIARLDRRLPAAILAAQPDLSAGLRDIVLGPVLALAPQERDVLLRTFEVWLDCTRLAEAAARLYCHPNTVLNRMHRIEELSGRSHNRPSDLVELALALHAHRAVDE